MFVNECEGLFFVFIKHDADSIYKTFAGNHLTTCKKFHDQVAVTTTDVLRNKVSELVAIVSTE